MYRRQGMFAESIPPLRTFAQLWDPDTDWTALVNQMAAAYSTGGRTGYLRQLVKVDERINRPWYYLALDYADLGDRDVGNCFTCAVAECMAGMHVPVPGASPACPERPVRTG